MIVINKLINIFYNSEKETPQLVNQPTRVSSNKTIDKPKSVKFNNNSDVIDVPVLIATCDTSSICVFSSCD